jgi:hypothetical protein
MKMKKLIAVGLSLTLVLTGSILNSYASELTDGSDSTMDFAEETLTSGNTEESVITSGEKEEITVSQEEEAYSGYTSNDDFRYSVDNDEIWITGYLGSETEVVIPSEIDGKPVRHIGDDAFKECANLTEITISESVTSIGNSAFSWCTSL